MVLLLLYKLYIPSGSSYLNNAAILPAHDESPTTNINIFPSPLNTLVPLIIIGDGTSWWPAVFYII